MITYIGIRKGTAVSSELLRLPASASCPHCAVRFELYVHRDEDERMDDQLRTQLAGTAQLRMEDSLAAVCASGGHSGIEIVEVGRT